MVASDDDGRGDLAGFYEVVYDEAKPLTLTISQPADTGRKPLELDLVARHLDPLHQVLIIGELLEDNLVGRPDVLRTVSYTHLRAHETRHDLVCRLLLE